MDTGSLGLDGPGVEHAPAQPPRSQFDPQDRNRDRRRLSPALSQQPRWLRYAYALMASMLLAYVVSAVARHDLGSVPALDDWGVAGFEIAGSVLCIVRALGPGERAPRTRLVPLVLGASLLAWALGDLVLAFPAYRTAPTPLLANIFYLGFYPLAYVGVMLLLHQQTRRVTAEMWLDGIIAGLGAAAIAAAFLFNSILKAVGGSTEIVATNLAFPVGDLLLLGLVIGGSVVIAGRRRLPWILLAGGLAINAIGDTANLFVSGLGATHAGAVADAVAWPSSILLVSISVWIVPRSSVPVVGEPRPSFVFPALACATSMVMLFVGSLEHISVAALALALATLAAAGVRAGLSVMRLQRLTAEKHRQSVTDQLTALANRRALFELLEALEQEQRATGELPRLACLFVDLNRFKEVNDSFGHAVGDDLLRQLGERLRGTLREGDLLARLGGDEFVVALLGADRSRAAMMAQRIEERLREPFQLGAVQAQIGASIGIAVAPDDAADAAELLRCADLAMYRAKLAGLPFALYSDELDGRGNRIGLVEDLRSAIAERALELHYQPQIAFATGQVVALEALVRWPHPRLGHVPPLEFLPLAESADLMDPLTELVLDLALEQCSAWHRCGIGVSVSVNLSSTNLHNPALPGVVAAALARHGVPSSALVLEVTETTAITDFHRSQQTIGALRDLGLVVSVDDFGAGFTSLAYLSSLAVGELKLDRSFIQGLADTADTRNRALVRSTIELAHSLGLRVVAEGIEDRRSFELLAALGCDLAQGYLISRPLPADELDLSRHTAALPVGEA